ncbi:MAG TPA: sugar porter family MFS transporter [Gaiellaceae bacterium]|nr:sugar porter family MFS transporter [Gaiellaceae bacterium]
MAARRRLTPWMIGVGGVTFLAGLLFGYDQGVISGALPLLQKDLGLSTLESEIVTSWVTLGALFGALVAGGTADRIGRRWTAVAAGVLFAIGALIEAVAPGAGMLTFGRVVTGLGVGFASVVAPLYAAEMAPKRLRGRFVSTYQLAITVGIFFAYLADDALTGSDRWRLMFALAVIPGAALVVGFLVMPESARWLLKMGRREEARASLVKVDGPELADSELETIEADLEAEALEGQASWSEVFSPGLRRALWVGVGLATLQQVTGINAIIYYANEIFAEAGFTTAEQQAKATLYAVGAVNVLATFIAVAWVDRFGRRPLLFSGLIGMTVSLAAVGFSFAALENQPEGGPTSTTVGGLVTVLALVVFIASFAFSLGPIVWTIISEIYPNRVRGRAMAVATAVNWFAAFLVAQFFLSLVDAIGESTTFFMFSALCIVTYAFVHRWVPETKGKSLEEIQERWVVKGDLMLEEEPA